MADFCKMFRHGLTIGPSGAVRPCCVLKVMDENLYIEDNWKSKHESWYKKSQNSETGWIPECNNCRVNESLGRGSLRNYANSLITDDDQGIVHWDLKINNTCNLACRTCDSWNSSTWEKLSKENPDLPREYTKVRNKRWHRGIEDIMPHLLDARVVKFTGGEPFLIPQVKKVIEYLIEHGVSENITLHFNTNGTIDINPWIKYFTKFKHTKIHISVDAIGDRFNYIRAGADWNEVSDNILFLKSLTKQMSLSLGVLCLPQALNVGHIHEVEEWCQNHDIGFIYNPPVVDPDFMSPEALTDPVLRKRLIENLKILDRIHGTDYRDFIDE
jgi:MoaA/NifB/PqqE/SkfB family radical SAM enzyme